MSLKNNHYRAVTNYRRGERHRWVTCLAASRVVGNYAEGETVNLAKDLGVSTMHVGRMAKAGMAYRMFRRYNPGVRGEVASPKHFYTMWDLWQEFEFSPREAAEQLRTALEEGTSAESLATFVRGEHEHRSQEWVRFVADINTAKRRLERAAERIASRDIPIGTHNENFDSLMVAVSVVTDLCDWADTFDTVW
jgi:hypothetical protein